MDQRLQCPYAVPVEVARHAVDGEPRELRANHGTEGPVSVAWIHVDPVRADGRVGLPVTIEIAQRDRSKRRVRDRYRRPERAVPIAQKDRWRGGSYENVGLSVAIEIRQRNNATGYRLRSPRGNHRRL